MQIRRHSDAHEQWCLWQPASTPSRIKEINDSGVSILLVEQNAKRALAFSDRGYVLDQGRNAYQGKGEELLNDPRVIGLYLGKL